MDEPNGQLPPDEQLVAEIPATVVDDDSLALSFQRPFAFALESPNWLMNTLLVAVCQFIPIVGPVVLMGYQDEVVIALLRNPRQSCPDFDFNRFGDYLMRGLWPMLVTLLWGLGIGCVLWALIAVVTMITATVAQSVSEETAVAIMICIGTVAFFALVAASIGIQMLMLPLALRAGLQKDFNAGMSLGFAFQFIGNTWREMIKFGLVMAAASIAAVFVGMLILCIGQYFTIGIIFVAQAHIMAQLYRLHCQRGGEPIPIVD